ncbi:MAG: efflux RND transporter permease subunit [Phycisphaerae bacterium]
MLDKFLHFILKQRLLVLLCSVILLVAGISAWNNLPIDAFPDVTNQQVTILTEAAGLTPEEVERLITFPIEVDMGGLPDVVEVRSLSKTGLSQVIIIFEDNVDIYFARQLVFERLAQVKGELPDNIEPKLGPISTGLGEVYQYALRSGYYCPEHQENWSETKTDCPQCGDEMLKAEEDLMDLRTIQNWIISPQLRRLSGVTEINSFGGFVKQYHVVPDPDLLIKYEITLDEVLSALEANNSNAGGSYIERDWEQFNVVSNGLLRNTSDIENIVLKSRSGTAVYMKDVAEVQIGHQTRNGAATQDGKGETVLGMVIMLKDSNSKQVVDLIRAEIPQIQKTLPAGVKIVPFYDRTSLIQACIQTVTGSLGQGIFFIVLILFIFLWDLRAAITVAIVLPMTAAAAFILMGIGGVTGNLMSLGGLVIAIGILVDGAIVVVENILRHLHNDTDQEKSLQTIASEALREVARPVIFAVLIVIIVFVPLFTLESLEGKMFKPLALTVCFALAGSLIVTLTTIPVLSSFLFKRNKVAKREHLLIKILHNIHGFALRAAIKWKWVTLSVVALIMGFTISLLPKIGTEFLPQLNEGAIAINVVRLPTANIKGSLLQATEIEKKLLEKFPEIETVVTKTGRAEIAEDPMGPEQNDFFIMLKAGYEKLQGRNSEQLVEAIDRELAAFPGIKPAFSQPIALRVNELVSGIKSDVAVKIFGDDMELLQAVAEEVAPTLATIRGASDVKIEQVSGFSQIEIQMNRKELARHKINIDDISRLVETAIGGAVATTVFEGQKRFDVLVRYPLENRRDIKAIGEITVRSPAGYNVPLRELVSIEEAQVPAQVSRENSRRRLIVECNVRGRDLGGFVKELKEKLHPIEQEMPESYRFDLGGQFENQQRAMARLKIVVPVAILLIFLMLFSSLNSAKSALLILANLPFALIGGIWTLHFFDINLSVAASVGFIALFGVAVEDGLVLISFFNQLRKKGSTVYQAVMEGSKLRGRAVILTTLTTLLGLTPMLYATGAGSEIQKPLVAVVFGGMISALLLELIVLPVLYVVFNRDST